MKKTKYNLFLITFLTVILITVGCSREGNQFNDNYNQFKKSYLAATEFIEKDNNYVKALATINSDQMNAEMEKMKNARDQMSNLLKTDREKGIYGNVTEFYKEVEYIVYASKNYNNFNPEEKSNLLMTVVDIKSNRELIAKGEV